MLRRDELHRVVGKEVGKGRKVEKHLSGWRGMESPGMAGREARVGRGSGVNTNIFGARTPVTCSIVNLLFILASRTPIFPPVQLCPFKTITLVDTGASYDFTLTYQM